MCPSCRNSQSKHHPNFLLLLSTVMFYKCSSAGAALTSVNIKKKKNTFPAVSQCRWPVTTNNQYRGLPLALSVCLPLPPLLLKCGKMAWSNYSPNVLSPVIFPPPPPYYHRRGEGVLMALHHHHIASDKAIEESLHWPLECSFLLSALTFSSVLKHSDSHNPRKPCPWTHS